MWKAVQPWKLCFCPGFYFENLRLFKSGELKINTIIPALSYYFLKCLFGLFHLLSLSTVKLKHPSLARLSLLCCQSNKIHNNLELVCVCACVDVFPISPGHPYPTLSQNPPLTHLKHRVSCFTWKLVKADYILTYFKTNVMFWTARPEPATPVEVFATCRAGMTGFFSFYLCTFVWN